MLEAFLSTSCGEDWLTKTLVHGGEIALAYRAQYAAKLKLVLAAHLFEDCLYERCPVLQRHPLDRDERPPQQLLGIWRTRRDDFLKPRTAQHFPKDGQGVDERCT